MDKVSSGLAGYVDQISQVGGELGPMVVKGMILLIGALVVLNLVGFPAALLFRVIMVIVMAFLAVYVIAKPYILQLPLEKGDVVKIGGAMGTVDLITIMHTQLRTFNGRVVYIPNHKVLNDQVANSSKRPNRPGCFCSIA
jgi:small conductance mechanosensitive channel